MEVVLDESIATANTAAGKLYGNSRHPNPHNLGSNRSNLSMMMAMNVSTNDSNLSVETNPPSSSSDHNNSNMNIFFESSSSGLRDSRHDSPKEDETPQEQDDDDAMMASEGPNLHNSNITTNSNSRFVLPPPPIRSSLASSSVIHSGVPASSTGGFARSRVVTGDNSFNSNGSGNTATNARIGSAFVMEEKVSLAPRFGSTPPENVEGGAGSNRQGPQELDINSEHLFSISGSMSSEFLEHQHHNPDHQREYAASPERRVALGMKSPTSTTARDFLREVRCPSLPSTHDSSQVERSARANNPSVPFFGTPPLHHHLNDNNGQRPPFHLQPRFIAAPSSSFSHPPPSSSSPPPHLSASHKNSSHPTTLMREHQPAHASASSPSSTSYAIPGVGSFCDSSYNGGREKAVISRCFAWSQDSQDERRITKRARMINVPENSHGQDHVPHAAPGSSPLSTGTTGSVLSPASALGIVRNACRNIHREDGDDHHHVDEHKSELEQGVSAAALSSTCSTNASTNGNNPHGESNPNSSSRAAIAARSESPTRVHWEEKVENSIDLMSRAVPPQVLFGSSIPSDNTNGHGHSTINSNDDVAMGDDEDQQQQQEPMIDHTNSLPPPITVANSASHYSFESL